MPPRGRLAARLDLAREHAIRSHEPQGWLGGVLIGAWTALLSLLAVALPLLLVWATSRTPTSWGQAVRVATQAWLLVHGVALQVHGGSLHLLPLGLTLLPAYLCWRAGRRLARSAAADAGHASHVVRRDGAGGRGAGGKDAGSHGAGGQGTGGKGAGSDGLGAALRLVGPPVAGLAAGYAVVLLSGALLAHGGGVRPVWWHALVAGLVVPLVAGGASALRTDAAESAQARRRRPVVVLADWLRLPMRVRRAVRPALTGVSTLLALGLVLVLAAVVVQHRRVLDVHTALDPGGLGTVVLLLGQAALLPDLALWAVAWFAGPGFAVGVGTAVTPAASTLGLLPLVPVLGALPAPGPLPGLAQAAALVPVLVGSVVGWRCARAVTADDAQRGSGVQRGSGAQGLKAQPGGTVLDVVLDALLAALLAAGLLTVLVLLSAGSAGPGLLADVGPSAWRVGLALLGELASGAMVTAWIMARRR